MVRAKYSQHELLDATGQADKLASVFNTEPCELKVSRGR